MGNHLASETWTASHFLQRGNMWGAPCVRLRTSDKKGDRHGLLLLVEKLRKDLSEMKWDEKRMSVDTLVVKVVSGWPYLRTVSVLALTLADRWGRVLRLAWLLSCCWCWSSSLSTQPKGISSWLCGGKACVWLIEELRGWSFRVLRAMPLICSLLTHCPRCFYTSRDKKYK